MCVTWKTCCCCISLEVGTQITGILAIVGNLLWLAYLSFWYVQVYLGRMPPYLVELPSLILAGVTSALAVIDLVFAIVFTVGAFKKRPSLLWPWIVMAWVSGLFTFVSQLVEVVSEYTMDRMTWRHGGAMVLSTLYPITALYLSCMANARRRQMIAEYYASPVRFSRTDSYEKRLYVPVTTYQYND